MIQLRLLMRFLLPLQILVAYWLLVRGHNAPGGGFIAGLVAGAGIFLYQLSHSVAAERSLRQSLWSFCLGVLLAAGSALWAPLVHGQAMMTGVWWGAVWLPLVGMSKIGTPFVFDVGVFLVVVGVSLRLLVLFNGEGEET